MSQGLYRGGRCGTRARGIDRTGAQCVRNAVGEPCDGAGRRLAARGQCRRGRATARRYVARVGGCDKVAADGTAPVVRRWSKGHAHRAITARGADAGGRVGQVQILELDVIDHEVPIYIRIVSLITEDEMR